MKVKMLVICTVIISSLLFFSCKSEIAKTDHNASIINNDNDSNITQNDSLSHSSLIYNLKKEIKPADEFIKFQKLIFPEEIDGKTLSVLGFLDKKTTLLLLFEENPFPNLKEIGTYNFELNNYDKLFETREDISIRFCDYNTEYIVFQEINDDTSDVELKVFDFKTRSISSIYKYNKEYLDSSLADSNKVTLKGKKLFFDDIIIKNDVMDVELYCTELDNMQTSKIKDEKQNPMLYNDEIIVIGKSSGSKYDSLLSLDGGHILRLPSNVIEMFPTDTRIYSLNNKYTDSEIKETTLSISDLILDEELLDTKAPIDNLEANDVFMSWRNFKYEKPVLYYAKEDKFLIFDQIPKRYNLFYFYESSGLLLNYNDKGEEAYYYFIVK